VTPYDCEWNEEPDENGRHPNAKHLILVEFEHHHGSVIVTSPAAEGSALLSYDDAYAMFSEHSFRIVDELSFGWVTDEYLSIFEEDA
jgi:hypothetical protein